MAILHNEFAAIILDIKMPGTNGLELAKLIKQRKRSQHVPILFLTAHNLDEKEVLLAYGVGGVDFLSKPINPDILRSKVAVFASLFRSTRALASAVEALNGEIAERQKVQEQLRLAKNELETRVLERTAELARATREVRDNEERFRLALAVAQVAAWEWDLASGNMRWSANPEILFGFPSGSFGPNLRISQAVHPDDLTGLETAFHRAMKTGDYDAEFRAIRPDGSVVWIAERGRVVQDSQSLPSRIVGVSVDLTRRKRLEEELLDSDRRKDQFLATLAHELRNPLAPVRYAVKVLDLKGPATPEIGWAIDVIERQTQHMTRLIDDLLDVNRISRNALELRKGNVELSAVIQAAIEASRPFIEQNQQELLLDLPEEPIYLEADSVRLAQVFSNLLNNAAKFSKVPDGTPAKIGIAVRREGSAATVTVRDSGIGIAPQMLPKVFDMFTQVGRALGQSEGGLGIGLALAKSLVEMHGGTIEAHSDGLGKGSAFKVRLPLTQTVKPATESPTATQSATVKRRILIADDNPDVLESFEVMLRMLGHEVETAVDGTEVLVKAAQFWPEVVVLDIGMPKMDGLETARRLRQQPWGREAILIAVTGWGNEKDKRHTAEAGFDVHLVKPVDAMTILKHLDKSDQSKANRQS
jgi:PAS domain S-box-containing protein